MPYDPLANPYIINPLELPADQIAASMVPTKNIGTADQWCSSPSNTPNWGNQLPGAGSAPISPVASTAVGRPDATIQDRDLCAKASLNVEKTQVTGIGTAATNQLTAINALLSGATVGVASVTPNAGGIAGGTAVTIQGSSLTGATGVTFGGTAATAVTVVNDGEITCTTPAHAAGAVTVVVTTAAGTGNLTNAFTYS